MTRESAPLRRLAARYPITAMALANCLGAKQGEIFEAVLRGDTGLVPSGSALPFPTFWGRYPGVLPELPPSERALTSRASALVFLAFQQIEREVARAIARYGAERVAIVLGSSTGGIDASEVAFQTLLATGRLPGDYSFFDQHTFDALVRLLAALSGARGPAYVVSTACSSSGKALAAGKRLIEAGLVDAVLTGGTDGLCDLTLRGFHALGILSSEPCRPFDAERSGLNIGEGSALLLLEREGSGHAFLAGTGESSDAHHATAPHPEGRGAVSAMRRALESAGIGRDDVGYINAHGTGTRANDLIESRAIYELFERRVPVSSTKDRIGHLLGAAGGTEAVFSVWAAERGVLPGNRPVSTRDSEVLVDMPFEPIANTKGTVLSNSFGFGGSNVSLLFNTEGARVGERPERRVFVRGLAAWAPGYPSLASLYEGRRGPSEKPAARLLSERARGRASILSRIFAELVAELGQAESAADLPSLSVRTRCGPPPDLARVPTVYASAYGEMGTTVELLEMMYDGPGELSPVRFQASVHNTASSLLAIASGNSEFSTAIAAGQSTFAMALVEAFAWLKVHGGDVLLLVADESAPRRLAPAGRHEALGIGAHLSTNVALGGLLELTDITRGAPPIKEFAFEELPNELLENPAAAGLAWVNAVATQKPGMVPLNPSGSDSEHLVAHLARTGGNHE